VLSEGGRKDEWTDEQMDGWIEGVVDGGRDG